VTRGGISVLVGQYELASPGKLTCGPRVLEERQASCGKVRSALVIFGL
jgi:hypothetical protein